MSLNEEKLVYPSIYDEPFYFESDSLALKGNTDYGCLLKTLVLLEAQRVRACQDLENLIETKEEALKDPIKFVNYLNKKQLDKTYSDKEFKLPERQSIYLLPKIDWNKYYDYIDLNSEEMIRNDDLIQNFYSSSRVKRAAAINANEQNTRASSSRQPRQTSDKNYNKSWSVEEQRTLEELLIEFPPEDNEAARWRKIATKLGTRTPLQVQSHCQKYFIKLAKAGLPVPGRVPNLKTYVTKKGSRGCRKGPVASMSRGHGIIGLNNDSRKKRTIGRGSTLNEISSMWSSFNPPIKMNDDQECDEDDDDEDGNDNDDDEYENSEYDMSQQFENDDEDYYDENSSQQNYEYVSPKNEPKSYDSDSEFSNINKS
jgi:hypothetical protein